MATGLFHRHARDGKATDDEVTAENAPIADERTATQERRADTDRALAEDAPTGAQREAAGKRAAAEEREAARRRAVADTEAAQRPHPLTARPSPVPPGGAVAPLPDQQRTTTLERERDAATEITPEPRRWARTSFAATLSLIVGTTATLTALTGELAPLAIAVGVVGLVFAAIGLAAVSRKHVTGHHVALLGLLLSIVGIVFGILAFTHSLPWLSTGADNVGHLRGWLDAQVPWLAGR
jgi:hypothetical protein